MCNVSTCVMSVLFNCSSPVLMRCNFLIVYMYGLKTAWKSTDWKAVLPPRSVKMWKQTESFFNDMSNLTDWQAFFSKRIGLFVLHNPLFFSFPRVDLLVLGHLLNVINHAVFWRSRFQQIYIKVGNGRYGLIELNRTKNQSNSTRSTVLRLARQSQLKFYCEIIF